MIPGLGEKYEVEIETIAKPKDDYMTDEYFELDLPVAPAVMVGGPVMVVEGFRLVDEDGQRLGWLSSLLLALTIVMLFLDQAPLPRTLFVIIMVAAMLTKAALIAGYFMHLKYEHPFLQWTFIVGLLINGTFMFALFIPDAVRIYHMVNG